MTETTMRHILISIIFALTLLGRSSAAEEISPAAINDAEFAGEPRAPSGQVDVTIVKAQILLSRAGFSTGEIDGKSGENFRKALKAYAQANGMPHSDELTSKLWDHLNAARSGPVITTYRITKQDIDGPFLEKIPARMEEMKDLSALSYTSVDELLAERFHMSQHLLRSFNQGRDAYQEGREIKVANVKRTRERVAGVKVEVDKLRRLVTVFGKDSKIIAAYPATVGSDEKPSPSGILKVTAVRKNPSYRYDPAFEFKGVRSKEPFFIKPGPNNPVGTVWIALSEKSYGIHGTPNPGRVSKSESNGCVRLTNWDAEHLATIVAKGTEVRFVE
jgi:lipoprotein-anchoring transpeptidase ErfK/SrfK